MRFAHSGRRLCGLVVSLPSLRTGDSCGCGEFPDLEKLGDLASAWGFDLVQLLPVNDTGGETSPYGALSAFALHPLYLRVSDLPELAPGGELARKALALRRRFDGRGRLAHGELLAAKLSLLGAAWRERGASIDADLETWIAANPWVRTYAAFAELKRRNEGLPWWEWPDRRDPDSSAIEAMWEEGRSRPRLGFWAWVQMRAAEQFGAAAAALAGRGIALMGDIPILMNKDSAEVWASQRFFDLESIAGAPPDMYAELGQNWGFPIYDWDALAAEDYSLWRQRLRAAEPYYSAYRIDHVLGFFRIWALGERERSGYLGRFEPGAPILRSELEELGFSAERIRWITEPHVRWGALAAAAGEAAARHAAESALDRIGSEELFLFKRSIRGESDIEALPLLSPAAREFLVAAWRDRVFFEYESGSVAPAWRKESGSAWPTLSDGERTSLGRLVARKAAESERLWAENGRLLLGMLLSSSPMLPCAEDLGSVPDCVPRVLGELGILGLRVLRWTRRWAAQGQPYVPLAEYPRLSVACASVHDSTSLRAWWEGEAERETVWALVAEALGRESGPCPVRLGPEELCLVQEAVSRSASLVAVFPIQDLVGMSERHRPADPAAERINVPGTVGGANWSYRMPVGIEELLGDGELRARALRISAARRGYPGGAG
jgi:4-alpha-glucanotransferase